MPANGSFYFPLFLSVSRCRSADGQPEIIRNENARTRFGAEKVPPHSSFSPSRFSLLPLLFHLSKTLFLLLLSFTSFPVTLRSFCFPPFSYFSFRFTLLILPPLSSFLTLSPSLDSSSCCDKNESVSREYGLVPAFFSRSALRFSASPFSFSFINSAFILLIGRGILGNNFLRSTIRYNIYRNIRTT